MNRFTVTKTISATTEEICKYAQHNFECLIHRKATKSALSRWWLGLSAADRERIAKAVKWVAEGAIVEEDENFISPQTTQAIAATGMKPEQIEFRSTGDKALSPPTARGWSHGTVAQEICDLLKKGPLQSCDLIKKMGRSKSHIFRYLQGLVDAGIIRRDADGRTVIYTWQGENVSKLDLKKVQLEVGRQHKRKYPNPPRDKASIEKKAKADQETAREVLEASQQDYPDGQDGTRGFIGPVTINGEVVIPEKHREAVEKLVPPKREIEQSLDVVVIKPNKGEAEKELALLERKRKESEPQVVECDRVKIDLMTCPDVSTSAPGEPPEQIKGTYFEHTLTFTKPATLDPAKGEGNFSWKGEKLTCSKCGEEKARRYMDLKEGACNRCLKQQIERRFECKSCKQPKTKSEMEFGAGGRLTHQTGYCLECAIKRDDQAGAILTKEQFEFHYKVNPEYVRKCIRCHGWVAIDRQPYWIDSCGKCWTPSEAGPFLDQWEKQNKTAAH